MRCFVLTTTDGQARIAFVSLGGHVTAPNERHPPG